jgi:hypothetical protein
MDSIVIVWRNTEGHICDTWYDRRKFRSLQKEYNAQEKVLARTIVDTACRKFNLPKCTEIIKTRAVGLDCGEESEW